MYSTIEETGVPYEISAKRSWDYSSDDKFTMGAQLGVQLDYRKLFFTLDYRHSFIRSQLNCNGFENTLQLGIGYSYYKSVRILLLMATMLRPK